jgi:hypothetical protein
MSDFPLSFLYGLPPPERGVSLGDHIARHVTDNGRIRTLLDVICNTPAPALWSPDLNRQPLLHRDIKRFIAGFSLPYSRQPLGPNDRVMMGESRRPRCVTSVPLIMSLSSADRRRERAGAHVRCCVPHVRTD